MEVWGIPAKRETFKNKRYTLRVNRDEVWVHVRLNLYWEVVLESFRNIRKYCTVQQIVREVHPYLQQGFREEVVAVGGKELTLPQ